jgi:tetratricopeptide (TPR) repeat protein
MRWLHTEYILKGLYLGLLLFAAIHELDWRSLGMLMALTGGGLVLGLLVAAIRKSREGYRAKGRLLPYLLFLLLESPELTYLGILLGVAGGAFWLCQSAEDTRFLGYAAAGGAVLGVLFSVIQELRDRMVRLGLSLALAAILVAGAFLWFGQLGVWSERLGLQSPLQDPSLFGAQLLIGIPFFYLLTLAGRDEETEVEIAAVCAALGLGAGMLLQGGTIARPIVVGLPILLYLWYTTRVLPSLRVFKHALRGLSYEEVGRHRQALLSFRRALQFDPDNALAREGLWSVHRALDFAALPNDPEMMDLIDLDLCLNRAASLLLQPGPTPEKLLEATRLLDLIATQRPSLLPVVHYWRSVALTHAKEYDKAAAELERLLDPTGYAREDGARRSVLLQAWQLALRAHPELTLRSGNRQLALPGRRMEVIGAVERHLASNPDDQEIWGFKRILYQDLTETEYDAVTPEGVAADFDHGYALQLGLALIGDAERWQRGVEYLRIAARGLPANGPTIYAQIAQAYQRAENGDTAWRYFERARDSGRATGPTNLGEEDRQAYFSVVKLLADASIKFNRIDWAIENYHLYSESARSGLETLRTLADLYERKGDPLGALRVTEQALLYNAKDKDLLERKDRYYYSVMPDDLRTRAETVRGGFDVAYCLRKSRGLLDAKNWDFDTLDWAQHLAELARVVEPQNLLAKVLAARARLRRGEKDEAVALLDEVRQAKAEQLATGDEEEAWYLANRMLGEMYLYELNKPDLAVACFTAYRKSSKSGADTAYKLAQAYEQIGDRTHAVKYYKHVVAYDRHPLAPDAQDALHRLQAT